MPLAYIPKSAARTYDDLPILGIYLVALPKNAIEAPNSSSTSPQLYTNHWVIHIAISKQHSIVFNPSPDAKDEMTLIISRAECLYPPDAAKVFQLHTSTNLTVGNLIEEIYESGHDRYQSDASGRGCRYWICSLVYRIQEAGFITDDAQVEMATKALLRVWDEDGSLSREEQQTGMTEGRFY